MGSSIFVHGIFNYHTIQHFLRYIEEDAAFRNGGEEMSGEKRWMCKMSRTKIYINHSILASIFIFLYVYFDLGYMKALLFMEAVFFIRSMRLALYVEGDRLYYRRLFKTESIPIAEIDRISVG